MSTDARKHATIAAGEKPTRAALAAAILSISDIVPVANTTEANQVAAALIAAGQNLANTPLTVRRADAPGMHTLEVTKDGTNWAPTSSVGHFANDTARDSWTTTNSALLVAGDRCISNGIDCRWTGAAWASQDTGEQNIAYASGWATDSVQGTYRVVNGMCSMNGRIKATSGTGADKFTTLPVGVRPASQRTTFGYNSGTYQTVIIDTDGGVSMYGRGTTAISDFRLATIPPWPVN